MKYKVGDWVVFKEPLMRIESNDGFILKEVFGKDIVRRIISIDEKNYFIDNYGGQTVRVKHKDLEGVTNIFNKAPSITKRINNKHHILNGLLNSDGSVDGEKLMEKLSNQSNDMAKGSHYEKAAMQPLEVAQRMFTKEQFKAILAFQVMKYRLRKEYKGQKESDEYKALQYCYWLELANKGITIDPSKDKVPTGYEYKGVIL